jgi:hypothetical protein
LHIVLPNATIISFGLPPDLCLAAGLVEAEAANQTPPRSNPSTVGGLPSVPARLGDGEALRCLPSPLSSPPSWGEGAGEGASSLTLFQWYCWYCSDQESDVLKADAEARLLVAAAAGVPPQLDILGDVPLLDYGCGAVGGVYAEENGAVTKDGIDVLPAYPRELRSL